MMIDMAENAHPHAAGESLRTESAVGEAGPTCAFPGCPNARPAPSGSGRPPSYCGGETVGPTGERWAHDKKGAFLWRRRYGSRTPEEVARGGTTDDAAHATGGKGQTAAAVTAATRSAGEQAQALAAWLDRLPELLNPYVEALRAAGDVDAAAEQVAATQREAERQVAEADARAEAAEHETRQAQRRVETAEQARAEADDLAADALAQAETAQHDADRARADAAAARGEAEDAQAERDHARDDAERRVTEAQTDAETRLAATQQQAQQRVSEAQAQAEETVRRLNEEHARELQSVRGEAEDRARAAETQAHETEQRAARTDQRADDAERQADWLRAQLDELRQQYRDDLAVTRQQAEQRVAELRAAYTASGSESGNESAAAHTETDQDATQHTE